MATKSAKSFFSGADIQVQDMASQTRNIAPNTNRGSRVLTMGCHIKHSDRARSREIVHPGGYMRTPSRPPKAVRNNSYTLMPMHFGLAHISGLNAPPQGRNDIDRHVRIRRHVLHLRVETEHLASSGVLHSIYRTNKITEIEHLHLYIGDIS